MGEGYKLKLTSKRLKSGKCQIKFTVSQDADRCYGYMLADAGSTLRQVVEAIELKVREMDNPEWMYHRHLYTLQNKPMSIPPFVFYKAS